MVGIPINFRKFVEFARSWYGTTEFIPLHVPRFVGREQQYVADTIGSTFVSTVGEYVNRFEGMMQDYVGSRYAVATVNGTAALHAALVVVGVEPGDEVITQSLTFIATCNAIRYCGAEPIFVDIERQTLGMSPDDLQEFLGIYGERRDGGCYNRKTGRPIRACVPMHTFGHPARILEIVKVCEEYGIALVEDSAEAIGSYFGSRHMGTFGRLGVLSFNGNKIITTGGGGMILTDDEDLARLAKHVTTTAKVAHPWRYDHDYVGYNYRMPNLNAALGCAQMESLDRFIRNKRELADAYKKWCIDSGIEFIVEPEGTRANYWLNTLLLDNESERDRFLEYTNANKVMTRPTWTPMHRLPMFRSCLRHGLQTTEEMAGRLVNVPSSVQG